MPFSGTYSAIPEGEVNETFLSGSEKQEIYSTSPERRLPLPVLSFLLLLASVSMTLLGFLIGQRFPHDLNSTCSRHTSKYSPILDDINISYNLVEFDGRFTKENVFRQGAGPEVDEAWKSLGVEYRPILLPDQLAVNSGLDKNHVHRKPELGGGYPVFMEGMHQLHCLNLVRKSLYYNYEYYSKQGEGAFSDSPRTLRFHVSHCLDILRQRLMCTTDTGIFGSVWVNRSNPHSFVDFNTKHVCKNFDEIRSWAERNQMPKTLSKDIWELPGDDVYVWDKTP
ncbi:protein of unknown function (DUF3328) domain containing protein [Hyaloscypha variabilis]